MKKYLFTIFTFALIIGNVAADDPDEYTLGRASDSFVKKVFNLNSFFVLKENYVNVTSQNSNDFIRLLGYKFSDESIYFKKIMITVERAGNQIALYTIPEAVDNGYEPEIDFFDFTGDGAKEIFYTSATGGSGGFYNYAIMSLTDKAKKVLLPGKKETSVKAEGKFVKGFKAEYTLQNGEKLTVDLSEKKEYYIEQKVYDEAGNIINPTELWITLPVTIKPVKTETGKYNIETYQNVKGICNADQIAEIKAEWEYSDGEWKLVGIK
jgi:hypothetical protein